MMPRVRHLIVRGGIALQRFRVTAQTARRRRSAVVVTGLVLLAAIGTALKTSVSLAPGGFWLLVIALALSLPIPLLSAAEYRATLELTGENCNWTSAVSISVWSSLFNILPLPGGIAIKLRAMSEHGARVRSAVGASAVAGLLWLSVSAASLSIAIRGWASLLMGVAITLLIAALVVALSFSFSLRSIGRLLLVEVLFVATAVLRFYLVLHAVGFEVGWPEPIGLAAAAPLSSLLNVLPGAIGVFEGLSAVIAGAMGLAASAGLIAAVLIRILLVISTLLWSMLLLRSRDGALRTRADSSG